MEGTMRFFFYGTLLAKQDNSVARALHALLGPGIAATADMGMVAIPDARGWYPALVPELPGLSHGFVHDSMPAFSARDLARADRYEGQQYKRVKIMVAAAGGSLSVQAYLWFAAIPDGAIAIPTGRFTDFLAEGRRAFGSQVP